MYLFERVIGVSFYSIVLIIVCVLLYKYSNRRVFLRVYWLILVVMAYFYIPHAGADLTRNIETMKAYARLDWAGIIYRLKDTITPIQILYYHLIGKLNNEHLLPAISAAITIGFYFSIIIRSQSKFNCSNKDVAIILFCFMARGLYLQTISNIRTLMSLAIVAFCIFEEFICEVKLYKLLPLYIAASFMHTLSLVLLLYRLAYIFVQRAKTKSQLLYRGFFAVLLFVGGYFGGRRYLEGLFAKTTVYYIAAQNGEGYTYLWEGLLSFIALVSMITIIARLTRITRFNNGLTDIEGKKASELCKYVLPLIGASIITIPVEFNFFQRVSWLISILQIPIGLLMLKEYAHDKRKRRIKQHIVLMAMISLLIACTRGDLCSLKFFIK